MQIIDDSCGNGENRPRHETLTLLPKPRWLACFKVCQARNDGLWNNKIPCAEISIYSSSTLFQSWRKTAETHKMTPEHVKDAGVKASQRPPGHGRSPGEVLHQCRRLPFSYTTMTIAGFAIYAIIRYTVLYSKKKSEANALDVARVATNTASPQNTDNRPRK
ncbi:uncharacterized protein [Spinacia oleracea]|uniref:Uncharacterized protein n=1 Tax=Spinacia oleracea TaxID=3562 RepID=A0ABM3QXC8_SPIOL|nr:uncharacterized protein LOC110796345 [Spinacia oleracea]